MSKQLLPFRVLVADDQLEVARSLLRPLLAQAGEVLEFPDGDSAYNAIDELAVSDVLLVDMRMPPGRWGGLDLIRRTRARGVSSLIVVVSGEGGQRETIEALRLGADDWIQKERANEEALTRVLDHLSSRTTAALADSSLQLPVPFAEQVSHYQAVRHDAARQIETQLAVVTALEAVWRFAALIGLASLVQAERTLAGVKTEQLVRPSMGIYADLVRRLQATARDTIAGPLLACVDLSKAQSIVAARNRGLAHPTGRASLSLEAFGAAETALGTFLRRFAEWKPGDLVTVTSMEYDGASFDASLKVLGQRSGGEITLEVGPRPLRTGDVYWRCGDRVVPCTPWMCPAPDAEEAVVVFDGVKTKGREVTPSSPFLYARGEERQTLARGGALELLTSLLAASS